MQNDILFDNIYVGHSVDDAKKLADDTFFKKQPVEKALEEADKPVEEEKPIASPSDLKFLDDPKTYVLEKLDLFLTIAKRDPIEAIKFVPEIAGGLAAILLSFVAFIFALLGGSSPAPAAKKVAADAKAKAKDVKDKVASATTTGADAAKEATKRATRSQS